MKCDICDDAFFVKCVLVWQVGMLSSTGYDVFSMLQISYDMRTGGDPSNAENIFKATSELLCLQRLLQLLSQIRLLRPILFLLSFPSLHYRPYQIGSLLAQLPPRFTFPDFWSWCSFSQFDARHCLPRVCLGSCTRLLVLEVPTLTLARYGPGWRFERGGSYHHQQTTKHRSN